MIDCEEAMIDLTSLRRRAKPAYVAGLTEITLKVCLGTYSPGSKRVRAETIAVLVVVYGRPAVIVENPLRTL